VPTLEVLSPGVYGFERAPQNAPEGVSPAKAAFVGWTDEGPSHTPVEVRSVEEFQRVFGNISALGIVPISVQAYFGTGGERLVIVRVTPADSVAAFVDVDAVPGPTKWTFTQRGEGLWGNDTIVRIRGNRNFLNRTPGSIGWDKFDVLVLRPSDFDPTILQAEETFEALQFDDPSGGDYILNVMEDPRRPSTLIETTEGVGGTPSGLIAAGVTDEILVAGGAVNGIDVQFAGTVAAPPMLDGSLRIIAADAVVDDEAQSPIPDSILVEHNFTLSGTALAVLDGSLRLFFAKTPDIVAEAPAVTGAIDSGNTSYTIAALALANPVHRESATFRIRFSKVAPSSPEVLVASVAGPATLDLSTVPLTDVPVHPGTVSIAVDEDTVGAQTITDDGAGNLVGSNGTVLALGGTINYATGAMTGITSALTNASAVVATYDISGAITKAADADNLAAGVALVGDIGIGTNTIDLVDSALLPTGNGLIDFETDTAPITGTTIFVDYVPLGIVDGDAAGVLTGDVGAPTVTGTNTVDYSTGLVSIVTDVAAKTATTIDADYQTGQVAVDNGLGQLIGDVDPAGANTIDYTTGAYDITWDSAPPIGTPILGDYYTLASFLDFPLTGGLNGSAVGRNDISAASLEASKRGIYALDKVEEPLNVVVPDFEGSEFVQFDMVQFARARADSRYLIMGFANGTTVPEAVNYNLVTQAWDEKIGALYYPNIYFVNPLNDTVELLPVTPFVAGIFAKTANNQNVGKAPGGIADGALDGVGTVGAEFKLELADRDTLYQSRVNPIIQSDATGLAVWGVRGLSKNKRWRYVNARLLHNFLMDAISRNLQWAVFESNGPPLWVRIETALRGFMGSLFRLGYFQGETEQEAFFVKCNATNNNSSTVSEGKVLIDIGFSPNTPAEFIIFTLQQPVGQTIQA
jgi:hypothetical protein